MPKILPQARLTHSSIEKLKPHPTKRRVIRDSEALFLIVQPLPSRAKSWVMRFRIGDKTGKIHLGRVDTSTRPPTDQPVIGQPLHLTEARHLASQILAQRAAGIDVFAMYQKRRGRRLAISDSFATCVKDFVEHARATTRGWSQTASVLGLDDALKVKSGSLADRWKNRSIKSITADDLHLVIEAALHGIPGVETRRDGPSEARQRKLFSRLSEMFGWLHKRRVIASNPMSSLHPPAPAKTRDRVLSNNEIAKVWNAFENAGEPAAAVLKLLLLTGCRLREIAELPWSEVADDCATLTMEGERIKNERCHVVPMAPMAQALLTPQRREGRFVFSTTRGTAPINGWGRAKVKIDAAAGIVGWRFHDLRRTCATGMASIGVQPHVIEAVLNHQSGHKKGVAGIYNRFSYAPEKAEALARWADHVRGIVQGAE
jgi:integrase